MEVEAPVDHKDNLDTPGIASFDPTRKKKKKTKAKVLQLSGYGSMYKFDPAADTNEHLGNEEKEGFCPWAGSDRNYGYEELLHRLYSTLSENNPELTGDTRRIYMKPVQVLEEGTERTLFVNFTEISEIMRRQPDHVMSFMLTAAGTSGYLDQQKRLIFRGRYATKIVDAILKRYIDVYVFCSVCRIPDTILSKEKHLFSLGCNLCGFESHLLPIKQI